MDRPGRGEQRSGRLHSFADDDLRWSPACLFPIIAAYPACDLTSFLTAFFFPELAVIALGQLIALRETQPSAFPALPYRPAASAHMILPTTVPLPPLAHMRVHPNRAYPHEGCFPAGSVRSSAGPSKHDTTCT